MARWDPDSRGRLREAAMELFAERGYENTTVAQIAERAGVTERTFFRHYADKREVLFSGSEVLEEKMVEAVAGAPKSATPMEAVTVGLEAIGDVLPGAEAGRRRQPIMAANAELRERELIKMASLSAALAQTLRDRGLGEPAASLTAETAIGVFKVVFERWIEEGNDRDFDDLVRESLVELKAVL
jgi:AcrR family transcriptional regulator